MHARIRALKYSPFIQECSP